MDRERQVKDKIEKLEKQLDKEILQRRGEHMAKDTAVQLLK